MKQINLILRTSTLLTVFLFLLSGCQQGHRAPLSLKVEGLSGDTATWSIIGVSYSIANPEQWDSTFTLTDGKAELNIHVDTFTRIMITPSNMPYPFLNTIDAYLEKDRPIQISAHMKDGYVAYSAKGSTLMEQYADRTSAFRKSAIDQLQGLEGNELFKHYNKLSDADCKANVDYALAHPSDDISAVYLTELADDSLLAARADELTSSLVQGGLRGIIDLRIRCYDYESTVRYSSGDVRLGCKAPSFSAKGIDGDTISLAQYAGQKYVVLDFWGSWCSWCMKGMPAMRRYQEKYKDRMIIIGVNCNDTETACRRAMEKQHMTWPQIMDKPDMENCLVTRYAVQAYPTKIIISPESHIVGYFDGEEETFYQMLDSLFVARPAQHP